MSDEKQIPAHLKDVAEKWKPVPQPPNTPGAPQ
mgnify:FL=1